ncbi:hypothetical protein K440DRAFT_286300 [Wilcoxina mikolae CBS 423.85]|nr:hypothetical protein K440DRAFT_286300 [Wilcoxina mikolae CBS 423.85]
MGMYAIPLLYKLQSICGLTYNLYRSLIDFAFTCQTVGFRVHFQHKHSLYPLSSPILRLSGYLRRTNRYFPTFLGGLNKPPHPYLGPSMVVVVLLTISAIYVCFDCLLCCVGIHGSFICICPHSFS